MALKPEGFHWKVNMVDAVHRSVISKVLPWRPRASNGPSERFPAIARSLGVNVTQLKVGKRARLAPWVRDRDEFFHVSWRKTHSLPLIGHLRLSWTRWAGGTFRMHPVFKVLMPLEAEQAALRLGALPEVEDMIVLEERRIDPILAVRVAGQWYEAHRRWQSPVILPDDCPLIAPPVAYSITAPGR